MFLFFNNFNLICMKLKTLFLFCLLIQSVSSLSQNASVTSFQHTAKRIDVRIFPNYISNKHLQDTILLVTSEALKKKFSLKEVILPNEISYKYYDIFGNPKLKNPEKSSNSVDYDVAILSSIRGTSEFRVFWNLEIIVQQNGITSYSNKKDHELEYFSPTNLYATFPWWNEQEFTKLFAEFINELIDNSNLPQKTIIGGSQENIEKSIYQSIPNAEKITMVTSGSFLSESDFAVAVKRNEQVLSQIVYHDGRSSSKGNVFSGFGSILFTGITTIPSSYDKKTTEIKRGKIEFSNGETHNLNMTWKQTARQNAVSESETMDFLFSKSEYIKAHTPLQLNIIKNDSLYGELTYFIEGEIYIIEGNLHNRPIHVSYAPSNGLIRVIENNTTKVIIEMHNINPETSGLFAGSRMLQNKDLDISNNKKFKHPEWYNVYLEPNCCDTDVFNYMESVYCLFFCIGHGI